VALHVVLVPCCVIGAGWLFWSAAVAWARLGAEPGALVVRSLLDPFAIAPSVLLGIAGGGVLSGLIVRTLLRGAHEEYWDDVNHAAGMDIQAARRLGLVWCLALGVPMALLSIDRAVVIGPTTILSNGYFSLGATSRTTTSVKSLTWASPSVERPVVIIRFADDAEVWLFFGGTFADSERRTLLAKLTAWTGKALPG